MRKYYFEENEMSLPKLSCDAVMPCSRTNGWKLRKTPYSNVHSSPSTTPNNLTFSLLLVDKCILEIVQNRAVNEKNSLPCVSSPVKVRRLSSIQLVPKLVRVLSGGGCGALSGREGGTKSFFFFIQRILSQIGLWSGIN